MKNTLAMGILCLLLFAQFANLPVLAQEGRNDQPNWGYEGDEGPDHWGDLSADFFLCKTGERQSPVDLNGTVIVDAPKTAFAYTPSALHIVNNGYTVQINIDPGSRITVNGTDYELVHLQFHAPSEHTINREAYPMELQLVHQSADGRVAIVAVLIAA